MGQQIAFQQSETLKKKPESGHLGFGKNFTDYMFVMDYSSNKGWHDARIVPYGPIELDPAAMIFHYGQEAFEGMKAFRADDGRVLLFRPEENVKRLNRSCARMDIPPLDEAFVLDAIKKLVDIERDWIPALPGEALYIRPFIIGTEPFLGVRSSSTFTFFVILSPVDSYFGDSVKPLKIYVEDEYVRAVSGGVGSIKTSANYATGLKPQSKAAALGFDQVLWLDAFEHKYIEEVGSMNIFFKVHGELWTPELNGSILPGVTRDSVLTLLRRWNVPYRERSISVKKLFKKADKGELEEVFGTGTAVEVAPVGFLKWGDRVVKVGEGKIGPLTRKLSEALTGIQAGTVTDEFGWMQEVEEEKEKVSE